MFTFMMRESVRDGERERERERYIHIGRESCLCVCVCLPSLGHTSEWNVTIVPLCNECESVFHSTQPVYSNSLCAFLYTSISINTVTIDPPNFGTSLYHYKELVLVLGVFFYTCN